MKIELHDGVVSVTEVKEVDGDAALCPRLRELLPVQIKAIEIDLSQTEFINCRGLGELIAVQKMAAADGGAPIKVINPPGPVQQLLELTRLQRVFEITKRP